MTLEFDNTKFLAEDVVSISHKSATGNAVWVSLINGQIIIIPERLGQDYVDAVSLYHNWESITREMFEGQDE